jgi:hypothetical protein
MPQQFFKNCQRIQRDRSINLAMLGKLRPPPLGRRVGSAAKISRDVTSPVHGFRK